MGNAGTNDPMGYALGVLRAARREMDDELRQVGLMRREGMPPRIAVPSGRFFDAQDAAHSAGEEVRRLEGLGVAQGREGTQGRGGP